MVSSHSKIFGDLNQSLALSNSNLRPQESIADYTFHPQWSNTEGWKGVYMRSWFPRSAYATSRFG